MPVTVEVWDPAGEVLDAEAHDARLAALVRDGGVATLATAGDQLAELEAVAGPVVAWSE